MGKRIGFIVWLATFVTAGFAGTEQRAVSGKASETENERLAKAVAAFLAKGNAAGNVGRFKGLRKAFADFEKDRNWLTTDSFVKLMRGETHLADMGICVKEIRSGKHSPAMIGAIARNEATHALANGVASHDVTVSKVSEGGSERTAISKSYSVQLKGVFQLKAAQWTAPDGRKYHICVMARPVGE